MPTTRTITSDTDIKATTTQTIFSDAKILLIKPNDITSAAKVIVNPVLLRLVKESAPSVEVGTASNPILFSAAIAGSTVLNPDNAFLLYNDKGEVLNSVDAKNIVAQILEMSVVDELVGTSSGLVNQVFSIAHPPIIKGDSDNKVNVKVGITSWVEVATFAGQSNSAQVFVVDYVNGTVTFGNNINGAIPTLGESIFVTYSPDTQLYGVETRADGWFGIQSTDVDRHDRPILLFQSAVIDLNHVQLSHIPLISVGAVQGIYLLTDPNRLGVNYFTGGTYNAQTGVVTLGTTLPTGTGAVLADYKYTIADDAEVDFTQLSTNVNHAFTYPIPSGNAKKLNFRLVIPVGVSPTNGLNIKVRLRFFYTEY